MSAPVSLEWVRYRGDLGKSRYLLALHLGIRDGKHVVLECQKVPTGEVELLKALRPQLSKLSLGDRIAMVKEMCPMAMRHAYRQISDARYEVVSKY